MTARLRPVRSRTAAETSDQLADQLADQHPVLAALYASRGVTDSSQLDYRLKRLAPVSALEHVDAAVDLLLSHRDERIIVIGDFDVDGATSTALFLRCLRDFGFPDVSYLVPNRFEYGYGLTPEIVAHAAKQGPGLIVTVDNGISSWRGVEAATDAGIPVLITDHHLPADTLPQAAVIVNPNLADSRFPSRNLAGVGVAFYVLAALARRLQASGVDGAAGIPARYLDLVALGTVADVVPLDANNRVLVSQGLQRIRAQRCCAGILALLDVAGRNASRLVSADLGFAVGPRLNAAGRLEDMSIGIECLLTDDRDTAALHAETLDRINKERRDIEATMRQQAFDAVDAMAADDLPDCVSVYDQSWHQGIVGLVAARVKERCHRPVIAFARESDGRLKGSARSIPGVHIRDLLEAVSSSSPGLIDKFGGHAMAAGLSLAESRFEEFRSAADHQMRRLYPHADLSGAIVVDGKLPADEIGLPLAQLLRTAGPWGCAFPEPVWVGDFEIVEQRTVGSDHLKMRVRPSTGGAVVDAIAFNQAGDAIRGVVRLVYRLDVNEFRGRTTAQLLVEQIAALAP